MLCILGHHLVSLPIDDASPTASALRGPNGKRRNNLLRGAKICSFPWLHPLCTRAHPKMPLLRDSDGDDRRCSSVEPSSALAAMPERRMEGRGKALGGTREWRRDSGREGVGKPTRPTTCSVVGGATWCGATGSVRCGGVAQRSVTSGVWEGRVAQCRGG